MPNLHASCEIYVKLYLIQLVVMYFAEVLTGEPLEVTTLTSAPALQVNNPY